MELLFWGKSHPFPAMKGTKKHGDHLRECVRKKRK